MRPLPGTGLTTSKPNIFVPWVINNEMIPLPSWDKITILCAKRRILIDYLFKKV